MRIKGKDAKKDICFSLFLLCKKYKFDEISVKLICERAGVTRMSFYRYFKNKEDVFIYFADDKFSEFVEIINANSGIGFKDFINLFYTFLYKHKESVKVLIDINQYQIMLDLYNKYFFYLWAKYVIKGGERTTNDVYLINFISGGFYNCALRWFKNDCKDDLTMITENLFTLIEKAAKKQKENQWQIKE